LLEHHYAGVPWPPLLRAIVLESDERWIAVNNSSEDPGNVGGDFAGVAAKLVWCWQNFAPERGENVGHLRFF